MPFILGPAHKAVLTRMKPLFVLGSVVIGLTLRVERLPAPGENVVGEDFDLGPGGKGLNQAIGAVRLGASVRFLAAVGVDAFGDLALATLRQEGIDPTGVHRLPGVATGCGFVHLLPHGENTITIHLGANRHLDAATVERAPIAGCGLFLATCESPPAALLAGLRAARAAGVPTLLNPAPATELPPEILALADVLTPNEFELRRLLGLAPDNASDPVILAQRLRSQTGSHAIVVTLGARGCMVVDDAGVTAVPALPITPVDPTGAGDAFTASLAVGLLEGRSVAEAAARAVHAGAWCAAHLGVIGGLPTRVQLEQSLRENRL